MRLTESEMVGKRFARLVVLDFAGLKQNSQGRNLSMWRVVCDCGVIKSVSGSQLKTGNTKSCGCQQKVAAKKLQFKDGRSGLIEYKTWMNIHSRCYNKKTPGYEIYGGRGIGVCQRWRRGTEGAFENFLADMGPRPAGDFSIERKNNSLGYSPENCIWATDNVQAANTSRNVYYDTQSEKITRTEMGRRLKVHASTLIYHEKHGKTKEQIMEMFGHKEAANA